MAATSSRWEVTADGNPIDHRWLSFYLGMQFVQVSGAVPAGFPNPQGLPVIESMELVQVRTGMDEVGSFTSSSEIYNGTHHIIDQAMQSNAHHVLTDCPHREKLGWLEVSYLMARSFQYRLDTAAWVNKLLRDIRDAQHPNGRVETVAPSYPGFRGAMTFTVEWGAAAGILPWLQYEWTGDLQVLRDNLDMMKRFSGYLGSRS
jgi:alpha-L-rhamnosidase